ncbi:MAG: RNA polymerase sigma factor [Candidatus Dojkabacteria bacterium]|jgi:RNA polymerase sigma-70 factor (ECF subfamily)
MKEKILGKKDKYRELSDQEIVELVKEDLEMYKYLIERYERQLLIYIRRVIYISKEDAEDILQDVFLKVYKNIHGYNSKYKFSSWIYRIAHNEAVSFLRKKKDAEVVQDSDIFDNIPSDTNIEDEFIQDLKSTETKYLLSKLDRKYRDVLVLRYFQEMEYNEISEILHIPNGTVASLISRGKKKFKLLIEKYGKDI